VAYIEPGSDPRYVWIAAPPEVELPADSQVEFHHGGKYIGHGEVEQRDSRFWYVRYTPVRSTPEADPAGPDPSAARAGGAPPAVGDDVIIRTAADIADRRFVARVFELMSEGPLINAGEIDGLTTGERGRVIRDGRDIGEGTVARVQRGYALVRAEGVALRIGDEFHLAPGAPPPRRVGIIRAIVDGTALTVSLSASEPPPLTTPLSIQMDGRTVGVAILLVAERGWAAGLAIDSSLTQRLRAGMELTIDSAPDRPAQPP
jgi:hypothetical protein